MTFKPFFVTLLMLFGIASSLSAESAKPVRMGCGIMTFDTVPGWGLRPDGSSALGPTHGAVVIDKSGNIYVSANKGVVVFSPDGKVLASCGDGILLWDTETFKQTAAIPSSLKTDSRYSSD